MTTLHQKLAPARFPNMSPQMAAILGYVLEREFTTPTLAEIVVTPDGHVLARPEGAPGPLAYIGVEAELRANLSRLAMAAGLDTAEWAEFRALVQDRLGVVFPNGGGGGDLA